MLGKNREQLHRIMKRWVQKCNIGLSDSVLILGGNNDDLETYEILGFTDITLSNMGDDLKNGEKKASNVNRLALDAECIALSDGSFDHVFVHEAVHHYRSPHKGLCEMLRISRKHVVLMEPNDSLAIKLIIKTGFSFPFEIAAVVENDFKRGGVRDSQIPNFIYRWNAHEVNKVVSTYMPEPKFRMYEYPYWCFNIDEKQLALRTQTKIGKITKVMGATNFLYSLKVLQKILNSISVLRKQGNKFFCHIEILDELRPWLTYTNSKIEFNKEFLSKK